MIEFIIPLQKNGEEYIEYIDGKDVCRFYQTWGGIFLKYGCNLASPRKIGLFDSPRILVRQIPSKPPYCINACYLESTILNDRNSMNIIEFNKDPFFVLGILNSKLISYWFVNSFDKFQRKTFPQFKINELKKFPVHITEDTIAISELVNITCTDHKKLIQHERSFIKLIKIEFNIENISSKIRNWINLSNINFISELEKLVKPQKLSLSKKSEWMEHFEDEKTKALELKNKINQTDKEIDQMVYQLYGLTDEEIKIIEDSTG